MGHRREAKHKEIQAIHKKAEKNCEEFKERAAISADCVEPLCAVHPVTLLNTPAQWFTCSEAHNKYPRV